MKNVIAYTIIMTFGIFVTFNTAMAAERVKVFELAESGQFIEFPMTAAEIAAEDAENARVAAMRAGRAKEPTERFERIELAESGEAYEFPMTAEEIAAEDARRISMRAERANPSERAVVVFELAESGQTFEFPVTTSRIALEETEIAKGDLEDTGTRLR